MTEPNEPPTPLSRMRFSWQRRTSQAEEPDAPSTSASPDEGVPAPYEDVPPQDPDRAPVDDSVTDTGTPEFGHRFGRPEAPPVPAPQPVDQDLEVRRPSVNGDLSQPPAPAYPPVEHAEPDSFWPGQEPDSDPVPDASPAEPGFQSRHGYPPSEEEQDDEFTPAGSGVPGRQTSRGSSRPATSQAAERRAAERRAADRQAAERRPATPSVGRLTDNDDARGTEARGPRGGRGSARPPKGREERRDARSNQQSNQSKRQSRRQSRKNAAAKNARQPGTFDVPAPGGRFSGGRGAHAAVRVTLVLSACLVVVGIVAYLAFSLGYGIRKDNTYQLSSADIARFRLTEFPLEQAGRFAADYARICLTHDATPGANNQREAQLEKYVSTGTDPTCGWNGTGAQTVVDTSWTGESEPINVPGYAGKSRMMTVRALTSAGSRIVAVPVYVANLSSADGMRIVGDLGEMPQPNLAAAPEPKAPANVDGGLGDALTEGEFFQQFFAAWGASNAPALQRFVTPDATSRTTTGLGGTVTEPTIREVRVFLPKGVDTSGGPYTWKTGMVTEAWVWVNWRSPGSGSGAVETRAYRLQLVKTTQASSPSQEWAVRDVRGGVPDLKGG
ncbi:conjugal transfer protein [Actinopolymorpha alba]|uniref:conjugal transfer protein n=1 Tax=Actinopolymorpha alba TaxID=533267 RepID=UPI00039F0FEF|nr:conjugal transfer protein [Actinopolymorpha alba]